MAQGFYTLEEAAAALGMSPDELNKLAQDRGIRAFSDRGTWRFRTQDVDDMVKQRGGATAPSGGGDLLPLSDAPPAPRKTGTKPKSGVKKVNSDLIPVDDDIFGADLDSLSSSSSLNPVNFGDDDDVLLGGEIGGLKPASGSGEKLVKENASFEFELSSDSNVRLEDDSAARKKTSAPGSGRIAPVPAGPGGDSDVRLDFAADAGPQDSLASVGEKPISGLHFDEPSPPTEEIDLDAQLQEAEDSSMKRRASKTKAFPPQGKMPGPQKTKATPPARGTMLPESSPFELSEDDLDAGGSSDLEEDSVNKPMGSEFELTLAPDEGARLDLDDDVDLGELPARSDSPSGGRAELSGINLHDPADSGISLEEDEDADDSVSFELTLDDTDAGPKTIKGKLPAAEDSDSEFELTLDETGLGSSASMKTSGAGEEKDIFETDFDLPALDDESASQAVALDEEDTDLESSDFDLAVESSPKLGRSDSGSVALEEDESADPDISSVDEMLVEDEDADDYSGLDEEEEEEEVAAVGSIPAAEAEWGLFPVLAMGVCVVLMFVCGLMAFELLHGMNGYQTTSKPFGVVARTVAGIFGAEDIKD